MGDDSEASRRAYAEPTLGSFALTARSRCMRTSMG